MGRALQDGRVIAGPTRADGGAHQLERELVAAVMHERRHGRAHSNTHVTRVDAHSAHTRSGAPEGLDFLANEPQKLFICSFFASAC